MFVFLLKVVVILFMTSSDGQVVHLGARDRSTDNCCATRALNCIDVKVSTTAFLILRHYVHKSHMPVVLPSVMLKVFVKGRNRHGGTTFLAYLSFATFFNI